MTEAQFLKTMIETIKYDDYKNKDELLGILRNSMIVFNPTSSFTSKSWQYWENIDLRVPIPLLKIARTFKDELQELAALVYIETESNDFNNLYIKPKPVELESDESIEHDVIFNEIKENIIQGIRNAKYVIWIAVAWFTDNEIFNELLLRKNAGVSVRVITSDEQSNQYLMGKLESNFEVICLPSSCRSREIETPSHFPA